MPYGAEGPCGISLAFLGSTSEIGSDIARFDGAPQGRTRPSSLRSSLQPSRKHGTGIELPAQKRHKQSNMTLSNPSPQLSAVLRWYDAITNWKFDVVEELFSEDYVHTTLPSSAKEQPKNKAQGLAHAKGVAAALGYTPLKVR